MQLIRRPLRQGEVDHELLWLTVSVGGLGLAATWMFVGLPWPVCWFHELTGEPCATCGATRAVIAFIHGQFVASWQWNPLVFVSCVAITGFDVYAAVVLIVRAKRFRPSFSLTEKRILRVSVLIVLVLNWSYLLVHSSMFRS